MLTLLDICLLNCCTYSCDYCISKSSTATAVNYQSGETCKGIYATNGQTLKPLHLLNFIKNHFTNEECIVQLSGGEPLLHDAFPFIVDILLTHEYKVVINTNGNQLQQLSKSVPLDLWNVYWRCSWHRDFRNINAFKQDISPIIGKKLLINYVAHPKRIISKVIDKDLEDLKALCNECNLNYEVTAFQGEWDNKSYDKNSKIYEPYLTALNPSIKSPAKEVNYLAIQTNGDIMRCHRVKVGNIYENRFLERCPQAKQLCSYENGNSNCGLIQAINLFGIMP